MANSEKRQSEQGRSTDDVDHADQIDQGGDSIDVSSRGDETSANRSQSVTRRLREILVEDGDGDLLLQRSDEEDGVIQWLSALDMQVMGACRADERLKPLLKLNASAGVSEDRLLAHLSQYFEPSEVGMLARCLCIPLVSIRVGKIKKQGGLLSPTSIRGNLCLTLLPTSDLRISFNGDDGSVERLATVSSEVQCHDIEIKEISADKSGRSFLIKTSGSVDSYFWCSEKSKLLGDEFLRKMKDFLLRKPSLAELTGISESRLNSFATHLRAYLAGSAVTNVQSSGTQSATLSDNSVDSPGFHFPQSTLSCQKSSRLRPHSSQGSKANLIHQSSLSPRSSSFKEGLQKSIAVRSAAREKLRRLGGNYVSCADSLSLASGKNTNPSSSNSYEKDKHPETSGTRSFSALNFLDVFGKSAELQLPRPELQVPLSVSSPFSPHYCWCPPAASARQYSIGNPQLPIASTESNSLPPLSSLLPSAKQSTLLTSNPLLNLADLPPLDFPPLLPDPLVRLPNSQQIPTFTPLICDPIVHIPVIDVCSSGQGYLVSAGTAMSTSIPPLNPKLVDPLLSNGESVVEKGARETLRMLINSSSQSNQQFFPSVLSGSSSDMQNMFAAGSRGLYTGTRDVDGASNNVSAMGLILKSEKSMASGNGKRCASRDDLIDQEKNPTSSGPSSFGEGVD